MIQHHEILIRPLSRPEDFQTIIDIWLDASIKAHNFIASDYWKSKVADMCNIYLPASDIYMAVINGQVVGFYAIYKNSIAALFVAPDKQGKGIGSILLDHAKSMNHALSLTVYKANQRAVDFYLHRGFVIQQEQVDPHTGQPELLMVETVQ